MLACKAARAVHVQIKLFNTDDKERSSLDAVLSGNDTFVLVSEQLVDREIQTQFVAIQQPHIDVKHGQ